MTKTFIIAEAGVNHNGSLDMAFQLIDVAVAAGADAVKFQTFKAEQVIALNAPKAGYQKETTGSDESQLEMVKKLELDDQSTFFFSNNAGNERSGINHHPFFKIDRICSGIFDPF